MLAPGTRIRGIVVGGVGWTLLELGLAVQKR